MKIDNGRKSILDSEAKWHRQLYYFVLLVCLCTNPVMQALPHAITTGLTNEYNIGLQEECHSSLVILYLPTWNLEV